MYLLHMLRLVGICSIAFIYILSAPTTLFYFAISLTTQKLQHTDFLKSNLLKELPPPILQLCITVISSIKPFYNKVKWFLRYISFLWLHNFQLCFFSALFHVFLFDIHVLYHVFTSQKTLNWSNICTGGIVALLKIKHTIKYKHSNTLNLPYKL